MTDTMLEKVAEAGYNLIIEGTLRTAEIPCRTAKKLQEHGYRVHLAVMAVPKEISYLTTLLRYLLSRRFGMGRAVAKAHHDGVVAKIPQNLKELWQCNQFATISLYSRRGLLYRAEDTDSLCGRFQAELARPWTTEERNWLSAAVPALEDTLTKLLQETTIVGTDDADLQAIFQEVGDRLEENK